MDSSLLISSLEIFAGLAMVGSVYGLMVALDVEKSLLGSISLFSLGLCATGFALMSFLFVLEPFWLGASSLAWIWIVFFAVIWALGASQSGPLSWLAVITYYPLYVSQYSTDTRPQLARILTNPSSPAITAISFIVGLLLLIGFRAGWQMNESLNDPLKKFYIFSLLLSSAIVGFCLSGVVHAVLQAVKVVAK